MAPDTPEIPDTLGSAARPETATIDPAELARMLADHMPCALLRRALRSLGLDLRAIR